jgi:huntingtin-interacting protein 1-related protein
MWRYDTRTDHISRHHVTCPRLHRHSLAQGKGANSTQQICKRNNWWTEGLVSAARSVAFAMNLLIGTADYVLSGTHSLEELIVASNEVAGATAQLVAASRVISKTQERLGVAAKAITEACKALVKLVRTISAKQVEKEDVDYKNTAALEFKSKVSHRRDSLMILDYTRQI